MLTLLVVLLLPLSLSLSPLLPPPSLLLPSAISYCQLHGLLTVSSDLTSLPVPFSLRPQTFPAVHFNRVKALAKPLNDLYYRIATNASYLQTTLALTATADSFTKSLLSLHSKIYCTPTPNPLLSPARLGLLRSDYMLTAAGCKQIEVNSIASSFGCMCTGVSNMHNYLADKFNQPTNQQVPRSLPNDATSCLANALALSHTQYLKRHSIPPNNGRSTVLFVIQPNETNLMDQYALQHALETRHNISVARISLASAATLVTRDPTTGSLHLADTEITTIYFRAGYTPADYSESAGGPTATWSGRALLENSRATKCPDLGLHLAGTKKVQQDLTNREVLEEFARGGNDVDALHATFAEQYSLGKDLSDEVARRVTARLTANPNLWVLKPQREGGGCNSYGAAIMTMVEGAGGVQFLDGYVLMERLFPETQVAELVRGGRMSENVEVVSELGIFSTFYDDGNVKESEYAGYLLRTKSVDTDEGGVAAGASVVSSISLT